MSKRIKIIFTLSVLLNIVLVCAGVAMLCRFGPEIPMPGGMSPEGRQFISRTYKEGRAEIKPLFKEMKARRAEVEDILTADTFDAGAYDVAVAKMLAARGAVAAKKAETMGRALGELPVEDRRKFARRILDSLEGHRPPHKRGYHHKMMDGKQGPEENVKKTEPVEKP